MNSDTVMQTIKAFEPEMVSIRRDIHAHPETGFEEVRTAALVANTLREYGIKVHEGIGRTGVVGALKGDRGGERAIALRADMDALFIEEKTGLPYSSTIPGKMHACGHDGHTAMLLGAARYLSEHRDFAGTANFVFQPAEEGMGGARAMLGEGLFDRFPSDAIYGMHNHPEHAVGSFGIRTGPMMAAADRWIVTFGGTGGHGGSKPHLATDPTIVQAHFVLAIQNIIGRNVPSIEPAVVSVGHLSGGSIGSLAIIPTEVVVAGTSRSFSPSVRDTLERRLREIAIGLAAIQGCSVDIEYKRGTPPLVNASEQTAVAASVAKSIVGAENVNTAINQITGAEDFACLAEQKPAAFIMIGNGLNADGSFHNVHTPHYDFNDNILSLGARYWVGLVQEELACR
jgi:amidohydrolase